MDGPFDSAWLKWAGAVVDAHVLADNVNAVSGLQPPQQMAITFWSEYHPKRHCIVLTVADFTNPFPPLWAVLLGNIVHNFRASLDHVAWALYKRGHTPNLSDKRERKVYFPIAETRTNFNNSIPQKLPGVKLPDLAKVRLCQPYRAPKRDRERHVLWLLDELDRTDKHRTIWPVVPVPDSTGFAIGRQVDCIYRRTSARVPRDVLQPGMELTRLYVKKTGPRPYIDVQPLFRVDPSIHPRLTLEEFLRKTRSAISRVLYSFADPPASVEAITGSVPPRP